jgi:hypothetical protein
MKNEVLANQELLSDKISPLVNTMKQLKEKYLTLWWDAGTDFPQFERKYSKNEKIKTEKEIDRFIEKIVHYIEYSQSDKKSRDGIFDHSASQARDFLNRLSDLLDFQIEETFANRFIRSTGIFLDQIKKFDPDLGIEYMYQALRNIWIMNSIQVFLGQKIDCTIPMFAYSMLYPYTDNILDDAYENLAKKLHLSRQLKCWLEGTDQKPSSMVEKKIFKLVKNIEGEISRRRFPGVYQSLLLIFNAQLKSLLQQKQLAPPFIHDVVGISFEKGGCSVLADGFLLKGNLGKREQDFCFGWGTFLQLSDDIQDIVVDKKNRHATLFSQIAGVYELDEIASKLLNYISNVLDEHLILPGMQNLKKFSRKSFFLMIMEAIGKNSRLYSPAYVKQVETHFPFSFVYLKKLRKRLEKLLFKSKKRVVDLDTVSAGLMALSSRLAER